MKPTIIKIRYRLVSYSKILLLKIVRHFKSYPVEKSMMIFGEPRSGSTWLMEMVANCFNCAIIWEPLHPRFGVNPKDLRDNPRLFEEPSNSTSKLTSYISDILTLKKANRWTLNFLTFKSIFFSTNTLTKCVRGSLLLSWLTNQFQFEYSPIYLIRHPIAMSLSQIKGKMVIEDEIVSIETFKLLYPSAHEQYQKFFLGLETHFEKLIAIWCLYHKYNLDYNDKDKKWICVYYEDLLLDPEKELTKICKVWRINGAINRAAMRTPSKTDFGNQLKDDPLEQLSKWKNEISPSEIRRAQQILDFFEIYVYTANEALPLHKHS